MIAILDYQAGNLASVKKALDHVGGQAVITNDPSVARRASELVLPGVGHFSSTRELTRTGLRSAIQKGIGEGKPFLGICVGMQWLYKGSTEAPQQPGLGHFAELCTRFPEGHEKVPQVGWNSLEVRNGSRLLAGVGPGEHVYFTHSYKAPVTADTAAIANYIGPFAAAVEKRNVMGVQFHPEKSGATGLKVLTNYLAWNGKAEC